MVQGKLSWEEESTPRASSDQFGGTICLQNSGSDQHQAYVPLQTLCPQMSNCQIPLQTLTFDWLQLTGKTYAFGFVIGSFTLNGHSFYGGKAFISEGAKNLVHASSCRK